MDQVKFVEDSLEKFILLEFFKDCIPQTLLGPFLNTLTYLISITSLIKALFEKKYLSFSFIRHSLLLQMICDRSRVTSLCLSKYYVIMEVEKAFICLAQCYLDLSRRRYRPEFLRNQ